MAGVILLGVGSFVLLLFFGHRGLREGAGPEVAFGGVCLSLATVLGCW